MEIVQEVLKWTGLDPRLFGVAFAFALLLRLARASFHWAGSEITFIVALVLGASGAWLKMAEHEPTQSIIINGATLTVAIMLMQEVLKAAAEKVPFLPKENQWVKQPPPPSNT